MHSATLSMIEVEEGQDTIHLFADIMHFEDYKVNRKIDRFKRSICISEKVKDTLDLLE